MSKILNIVKYNDPGHGWYAIKRQVLADLGIQDKISLFSYQFGASCYLEEDCDAEILFKALDEKGIKYNITEKHTNNQSHIRSYNNYRNINPNQL